MFKNGSQIARGDRFKDRGKWYTADADPIPVTIGGRAYDGAWDIPVGPPMPDGYGPPTVMVFAGQDYPVGGSTAIPLRFWHDGERTVEVIFRKGEFHDWVVRLASNGRELGYLDRVLYGEDEGMWQGRLAPGAFRGTGPDDTGDVLDEVPEYLRRHGHPVAVAKGREEAAGEIVRILYQSSAPALGFGAHYAVRAHVNPWCPGTGQAWEDDGGKPACPACKRSPGAGGLCASDKPRRRSGRWAGKVPHHLPPSETRRAS